MCKFFKIRKLTRKWDRSTGKFHYNIRFKTRTEITPRTIQVSEAFGLGVDEFQEHVIYDNVEFKIDPEDIVLITGQSGSGKSVLLRALEKDLGFQAINIRDVLISQEKPLIDTVGETLQKGLELLSRVGLNDAFLFIRRYDQLSDGQKHRYRIAKLIESRRQFWVMDEFASTLDRDTAKIVAFNVQKLARKSGRAVLAATTHEDLLEDLAPSVYIKKGFGKQIEVEYLPSNNIPKRICSVAKDLTIEEGSKADYKKLAAFHYRDARAPVPMKFFVLKRVITGDHHIVGVIVYSYPDILAFGRKKAFGRRISVQELNEKFALISRIILHPKYRSIGLGVRLVKETLPLMNKPFIETIAVMAKYNPFFEKAGMQKIAESTPDKTIMAAVEKLRKIGFNPVFLASEKQNLHILKKLTQKELKNVKEALLSISSGYYKRLKGSHKAYVRKSEFKEFIENASLSRVAKVLRRLAVLSQTKVYLLWRNPAFED